MHGLRLVLLATLAGGAVMVLEIVAPRMLAPHLGTDALTWTATISTFLAGLALGNAVGGRLADTGRRGLLPVLFALGAAAALAMGPASDAAVAWTHGLAHAPRVLLAVPLAFLPVAAVLGTLPPILARNGLACGLRPGLWIGLVGGAGAVGSVAGTLLAGYTWIPTWGLSGVVLATAGVLATGALLAPWRAPEARREGGERARTPASFAALAFLAGAGILAMEVVAGRIGGARLGSSLYTWTSIIGVVLAGLAIGGPVGGYLADRFAPRRLLAWLLVLCALGCVSLLWAPTVLSEARGLAAEDTSLQVAILLGATLAFLPASILLATVTPVVVRAALGDPGTDGRVVGRLYAIGTLGAVVGALLTGGVLVPLVGLERMTLFLAFAFASASGFVARRQPYLAFGVIVFLAALLHGPWSEGRSLARSLGLPVDRESIHLEDSRYARIRVLPMATVDCDWEVPGTLDTVTVAADPALDYQGFYDEADGRLHWRGSMTDTQRDRLVELGGEAAAVDALRGLIEHGRRLRLDRLIHGYVHTGDPTWLGYGYERLYARILERVWPPGEGARCFFIGGGAYAFQRHLLATRGDELTCVTAEIDPRVTAVAREWLALEDDPRHRIHHADARTLLQEDDGEGPFDLVFGDAFDHIAVPFHLTTYEFAEALKARMAPDGVYMVNVIDSLESGRFLGAFLHTLRQVFDHVTLTSQASAREMVRDTFVVVASDRDLGLEQGPLEGVRGADAWVYGEADVDAVIERAGRRVLTDDDAPVEVLLAPVLEVRQR